MKILVISESINVEDSSASKVNLALITNLKKAGHQLKVLHFSHKEIKLSGIDCLLIKENRTSLFFILSRLVSAFQRLTKIYINKDIERFIGFSFTHTNDTLAIKKSIKKNLDFNPDLVLTLSKGGSFRPHRAMLKLPKIQNKWLAYIHDPYPFHFYPRPYNWVEKSYQHKENFMLQITEKAKHLAFPSQLLKDWLESYFPAIENKSLIIPHQINQEEIKNELPNFFDKNQFSLLHGGNLLKQRNPKFLIEGYLNFIKNHPEAIKNSKLYLIGGNDSHSSFLESYKYNDSIFILNYLEYNKMQTLEMNASVNIILEAISEISPFLPGKFPNCVKANKPIFILGPYYSEVKRLLGTDYPYWSEANDVNSIEKIITTLYTIWIKDPQLLQLNRSDLFEYSNEIYLKKIFESSF